METTGSRFGLQRAGSDRTTGCTWSTIAARCGSSTPRRATRLSSAKRLLAAGSVRLCCMPMAKSTSRPKTAAGRLCKPTEDGFDVLSKGRVDDTGFAGSPIVADGRLYFPRHHHVLFCVGSARSQATSGQPCRIHPKLWVKNPPSNRDIRTVAHDPKPMPQQRLCCAPVKNLELTARVFNALGQQLRGSQRSDLRSRRARHR